MFYIGEGETQYRALLDLYKECRSKNFSRIEFLEKAAMLPGIYVPQLYNVEYNEDGTYSYSFIVEMDKNGSERKFKVTAK